MFEAWEWGTYIFFAVFLAGGIAWVWYFLVSKTRLFATSVFEDPS
jgi:hypothetical protein